AVLPHRVEHLVPPRPSRPRVAERIEDARRLRQAREGRRLHKRQLRGVLREVRPGGRLRAVRVAPVEDLVEVVGEDLLARVLAVAILLALEELLRETGLPDLP